MRKVLGIARYTFIEILRNKVWYVLVLFSGVLILSTLLLGSLGGEQKSRIILDLGLASIEFISLLSTVFAAVSLILQEMESRTLYLILSRPVARSLFIFGRFFGLIAIMTVAFALMALAHAGLLALLHISIDAHYLLSLVFSWEKIVVITAVALVFSLFSTSTVSAVTFTFFFWIAGHFGAEILFLSRNASQRLITYLCQIAYYLFPNFQLMNIRDLPMDLASPAWLWSAGGYGLSYTAVCLALASVLFQKKEF